MAWESGVIRVCQTSHIALSSDRIGAPAQGRAFSPLKDRGSAKADLCPLPFHQVKAVRGPVASLQARLPWARTESLLSAVSLGNAASPPSACRPRVRSVSLHQVEAVEEHSFISITDGSSLKHSLF